MSTAAKQAQQATTRPSASHGTETRTARLWWLSGLALGVCAVTLFAHWPVLGAQASTFDDGAYLVDNPLVQNPSWNSTQRFLTEILNPSTVSGYYQPVAMISLMLDWAAGARARQLGPVHRTSLAIHVLNTALVVVLFYLLFGAPWIAALVGLLFGVHPLTAEPVAWLSERKTLLAMFFFLWALVFYLWHVRRGKVGTGAARAVPTISLFHDATFLILSLVAFLLALLSKPTSTPLPVLLMLLDFWPLRRLGRRTLFEKVPFFIVAFGSAIVTYVSQSRAAFVESPGEKGLGRILLTICHNIVFYLQHFVWPVELTSYYPFPRPMSWMQPAVLAGVIGTVVLLGVLLVSWRWTRAVVAGWLFFFLAVFPTLGIIGFTNVIASMRYLYLPSLGFLLVVAAGLRWVERKAQGEWPAPEFPPRGLHSPRFAVRRSSWRIVAAGVVLVFAGFAVAGTRHQHSYWRDTETLYVHMLESAPDAPPLLNDLGTELARQERYDEAAAMLRKAVAGGGPTLAMAHCNLGLALEKQGHKPEAFEHFRAAVQMQPTFAPAQMAFGRALLHAGVLDQAAWHLQEGVRLKPGSQDANHPIGQLLARQGRFDEALSYLERALASDPNSAEIQSDLGNVQGMRGDWRAAVEHYQASLRLKPDQANVLCNLGTAWRQRAEATAGAAFADTNALDEAATAFRAALRLDPNAAYAYLQLGQILQAQGTVEEAIAILDAGLQVAPQNVELRAEITKARLPAGPDEGAGH